MAEFSDRLNEALLIREMTPAELSRRTGIGEGAISQYRKGAYKATQSNLEKIANALSVSIPWLMGATDDPLGNGDLKAPTPNTGDGRMQEILALCSKLTADQQALIIAQLKVLLTER